MSLQPTPDASMAEKALQSDIEILYAAVGHALSRQTLGVAPGDRQSLIAGGEEWIKSKMTDFCALICSDASVSTLILKPTANVSENIATVCTLADVIIGVCGGIPAVYVSTLLLKIGLRELCQANQP